MSKQKPLSKETQETIHKIAISLSYKFRFDCYDQDDAYQEAYIRGIKAFETYKEDKGPLENYLRRCMRTRMINYERDMNRSKKDIPKEFVREEAYEMDFEETESEYIQSKLSPEHRALFLKMIGKGRLSQVEKDNLFAAVEQIYGQERQMDE